MSQDTNTRLDGVDSAMSRPDKNQINQILGEYSVKNIYIRNDIYGILLFNF